MTCATRYAHHIGRVGGLAFALGVGAAIAHGSAVAAADTGSQDRSPRPHAAASAHSATPAARSANATGNAAGTVFARRPSLSYNAATNVQLPSGSITGTLNPSATSGYGLTYTVANGPTKGAVSIGSDGTFDYTPGSAFATLGGTDTFTVGADDQPDNPWHLHGLSTFFAPDAGHTATAQVTVLENPGAPIPASVLATPEQLAAEQRATTLANSPVAQLAKLVLKAGWILAANRNYTLVGGPDAENMARLDQAATEYATQAALEVQLLDSANPIVIQQVAPPHDWYQQSFAGSRIWYDNPDTIYRFIGVNSASSYVITGRFDPNAALPADTNFSVLTGLGGNTASNLNGRDLVINPDGTFTITASSEPAAPGETNHLQLAPGTTLITTRNTLSDWTTQQPMSLSIQRVSGPPPSLFSQIGGFAFPGIGQLVAGNPLLTALVSLIPPLPSGLLVQQIETAAIMLLLGISGENRYMGVATTDQSTGQLRQPNTLSNPDRNAEFLSTQLQSAGYFQLTDDQALVVTINPGSARYFNVPITDDWTITGNYWDEQASLNNAQAVANPDGTYTLVISPTDPGVANWISTGGLNQGTISIRFQDFDRNNPTLPTVGAQVVTLSQISPDFTADERAYQLAQRQLGYYRRYAPYPQA